MFFRRNDSSIEIEETEPEYSLLIHFTPVATYVYTIEGYFSESAEGAHCLFTEDGRDMEIGGTVVSMGLNSIDEIEGILDQYQLRQSNLPVVRLKARNPNLAGY